MQCTNWAVWDREEYLQATPDAESGIYEAGFPTRATAEAAIPRIQASLAEHGFDVAADEFIVLPRVLSGNAILDTLGVVPGPRPDNPVPGPLRCKSCGQRAEDGGMLCAGCAESWEDTVEL